MQEHDRELQAQRSADKEELHEQPPVRRKWQPPKGEVVAVSEHTQNGVLGGVDGVSCHS